MIDGLKAVVLDLDGTLIDSAPDIATALNALLTREGHAPYDLDAVRGMIGGGVPKLVERAYDGLGITLTPETLAPLAAEMIKLYAARPVVDTAPFPGAAEAVEALHARGLALGLCTNKPQAITETIIEALGWTRYFGAIVGGDATPGRKPDPAPLRAALDGLGAAPHEALMVGDSGADTGAARALGMKVVLVTYGYSRKPVAELGADALVDDLRDVAALLPA